MVLSWLPLSTKLLPCGEAATETTAARCPGRVLRGSPKRSDSRLQALTSPSDEALKSRLPLSKAASAVTRPACAASQGLGAQGRPPSSSQAARRPRAYPATKTPASTAPSAPPAASAACTGRQQRAGPPSELAASSFTGAARGGSSAGLQPPSSPGAGGGDSLEGSRSYTAMEPFRSAAKASVEAPPSPAGTMRTSRTATPW
mmetsp:Transcript_5341/g.16564  ORF Transcript_5341/g.16564 Transcript_5341/m.16564 type:complete len:202 (-) Transcript_5341:24-629(-)